MKTLVSLIALFLQALPSHATERTQPGEMQPLDKDIPLAEGIRQANQLFPDAQPLTEDEVIAAVRAIKLIHRGIKPDVYETYMRVVNERVLPRGMYFLRITSWSTEHGRFQVDWKDLCLAGRVPTAEEKRDVVTRSLWRVLDEDAIRVGGFGYRIRARFVSSNDQASAIRVFAE